jgi:drug/metabolite transporter (DMT)-like permease
MTSALILIAILLTTLLGDYYLKLASSSTFGLRSTHFLAGAVISAIPAFGWFFLMRDHSLATIGVIYSASTIILLAAMGVILFKETFGVREAIGISLAIASVVIMVDTNH